MYVYAHRLLENPSYIGMGSGTSLFDPGFRCEKGVQQGAPEASFLFNLLIHAANKETNDRLVPTLRGDPAWIFGHFGLSVARLSTRQSMGKSQKRPAADSSPSTIQKMMRKPACHEHVISIDMLARDHKQVRLENSKRSFRNRGGKNHAQTQTTNRNFDVNSGRSGERYEAEIQQSTE